MARMCECGSRSTDVGRKEYGESSVNTMLNVTLAQWVSNQGGTSGALRAELIFSWWYCYIVIRDFTIPC
jgi:hypothetical protein